MYNVKILAKKKNETTPLQKTTKKQQPKNQKVGPENPAGRQFRMISFFVKSSFPKVVVGNLSLLLLFSYKTTDPRLNSSGMTATATTDPVTLRAEHRATTSAKKTPGVFPWELSKFSHSKNYLRRRDWADAFLSGCFVCGAGVSCLACVILALHWAIKSAGVT